MTQQKSGGTKLRKNVWVQARKEERMKERKNEIAKRRKVERTKVQVEITNARKDE